MIMLAIANLTIFFYQPMRLSPFDEITSGHHLGGFLIFGLRLGLIIYLPLVIVGTFATLKSIYNTIIGIQQNRVLIYCVLISLILVTYGTYWKKSSSEIRADNNAMKWDNELLIKFHGDEVHSENCIWRGDTIIKRRYIGFKNYIDTLMIDSKSNTCSWTYMPDINFEIIFDHRDKFKESASNITYAPVNYYERFQYVINSVNNKPLNDYYCEQGMDGYSKKYENNSMLCFVLESNRSYWDNMIGYVRFRIEDSKAVFVDSVSNIYNGLPNDVKVELEYETFYKKNGMPIIQVNRKIEHGIFDENFIHYYDYYDIEKTKFVLSAIKIESKVDSITGKKERIDIDYYPLSTYQEGYPDIKYNVCRGPWDSKETLETGRYIMVNGEYEKVKD